MLQRIYRQSAVRSRGLVLLDGEGDHTDGDDAHAGAADVADACFTRFYPPPDTDDDRGPTVAQRMARYTRQAPALAARAARAALQDAEVTPCEIAHLVTVSCTGFSAPGVDVRLIDALGLRRDVSRTLIGFMGCHGAINGLRTADGLARQQRAGGTGRVLLCCVELCSLHFQYGWNPQRVVANALFADGAAAVVADLDTRDAPGDSAHNGRTNHGRGHRGARGNGWQLLDTGSCLLRDSHDAMTWSIGDHGFEMTLSPEVPGLIERDLAPWLSHWLARHGLAFDDIGSWAVHPGGPRVLDAVERALALPRSATDASRRVLAESGNMSSPTVLFILDELRGSGAPLPCVMLAFGPGLTIETALLGA